MSSSPYTDALLLIQFNMKGNKPIGSKAVKTK